MRYVSPVARAQRQGEAESFLHALQFVEPLARLDASLLDNFDADAIVRDTREIFGYPSKYLKAAEAAPRGGAARTNALSDAVDPALAQEAPDPQTAAAAFAAAQGGD